MPQTTEQIKLAELDKREQQLNALAEQLQRDGAHLYAEAKRKVAAEQAALDQREAALAPKEVKLHEREGIVAGREAAIGSREQIVNAAEMQQRQTAKQQAELDASLRQREQAVKDRESQHLRLQAADLAQVDEKRKQLREEFEIREARLAEEKQSLEAQRTDQSKREAGIQADRDKADMLLKAAGQRDKESRDAAKDAHASQDERERSIEQRASVVAGREAKLAQAITAATEKANATEAERVRLMALGKGLERAKVDIEIKQAKVEKLSRLVRTVIEQKKLKDSLSELVSPEEIAAFLNE